MARRKRDPNDQPVDETILASAMSLFGELGFEATSIKTIAERADLTSAAIYYHFDNKQDMLFKGLEKTVIALRDHCLPVTELIENNPAEALVEFIKRHILFQFRHIHEVAPTYAALVYGMRRRESLLSLEQRNRLKDLETQHLDILRKTIREGINKGVFDTPSEVSAYFAIIGMCEHLIFWVDPTGKKTIETIASEYGDVGLRIVGYRSEQ